jgi:hypothetical protein
MNPHTSSHPPTNQPGGGLKKPQVSRRKNRIELLKLVANYLESAPKEQYIELEIDRLQEKIAILSNRFNSEDFKDPREAFKQHEKDMGIPLLRTQLRILRYIKK